jgi:hypothetical protein
METFIITFLILLNLVIWTLAARLHLKNRELAEDILALQSELESSNRRLFTVRRDLNRAFGVSS